MTDARLNSLGRRDRTDHLLGGLLAEVRRVAIACLIQEARASRSSLAIRNMPAMSSALIEQDAVEACCVGEGVRHWTICVEVGGAIDDQVRRYIRLALDAPDRHRIVEVRRLRAI